MVLHRMHAKTPANPKNPETMIRVPISSHGGANKPPLQRVATQLRSPPAQMIKGGGILSSRRQKKTVEVPTVPTWSGRQDLNLRPLAPHASALPDCATPRERESIQRPNQTATDELALAPESFLGAPSP